MLALDTASINDQNNKCEPGSCLGGTLLFILAIFAYIIAMAVERCQMHGQLCDPSGLNCEDIDVILNCGVRAVMEVTVNSSINLNNCGADNLTAPSFNLTAVHQLVTRGFMDKWNCPTNVDVTGGYAGEDSEHKVHPKL